MEQKKLEENKLPKRKHTRLKAYDYSTVGAYFLTICTQGRKRILSKIVETETIKSVGEGSALPQNIQTVGEGSALPRNTQTVGEGSALPRLTRIGQITEYWLKKISEHYPTAKLGDYVIMPNHIHLVLFLEDTGGRADPSPTVSNIIGWLKYNITKTVNLSKEQKLFQRSFYDHIIRDGNEYTEICNYIYLNPQNWERDELYCAEEI